MIYFVCGGRDYLDANTVRWYLSMAEPACDMLVCGGARGADQLGLDWALDTDTFFVVFPADWDRFGRSAGPIRNRRMGRFLRDSGRHCLGYAFPGGAGTSHMIDVLEQEGIEYEVVSRGH